MELEQLLLLLLLLFEEQPSSLVKAFSLANVSNASLINSASGCLKSKAMEWIIINLRKKKEEAED